MAERWDVESDDGGSIAVWVEGTGPPLVVVHGSVSDHSVFTPLAGELDEEFTTFAMDRRLRSQSGRFRLLRRARVRRCGHGRGRGGRAGRGAGDPLRLVLGCKLRPRRGPRTAGPASARSLRGGPGPAAPAGLARAVRGADRGGRQRGRDRRDGEEGRWSHRSPDRGAAGGAELGPAHGHRPTVVREAPAGPGCPRRHGFEPGEAEEGTVRQSLQGPGRNRRSRTGSRCSPRGHRSLRGPAEPGSAASPRGLRSSLRTTGDRPTAIAASTGER